MSIRDADGPLRIQAAQEPGRNGLVARAKLVAEAVYDDVPILVKLDTRAAQFVDTRGVDPVPPYLRFGVAQDFAVPIVTGP